MGKNAVRKRARQEAEDDRAGALNLDTMPICLEELETEVVHALRQAASLVRALREGKPTKESMVEAQQAADAAREATFPYLEDPVRGAAHSAAYSAACCFLAEAQLAELDLTAESDPYAADGIASSALRALDLALLRGGAVEWGRVAAHLIKVATAARCERPPTASSRGSLAAAEHCSAGAISVPATDTDESTSCAQYLGDPWARPIPRVDARGLSVDEFRIRFMESNPPQPVVLTHALEAWPALTAWRDLQYLQQKAAGRLVPVEVCAAADAHRSFLSETWSHRVMSLGEYITRYVARSPDAGAGAAGSEAGDEDGDDDAAHGYLAQHPLFDQVPSLRDDIVTPPFCRALTAEDAAAPPDADFKAEPLVSAWFGPAVRACA